MIVIDSSAAIELLLKSSRGSAVAARIAGTGTSLHAPHLIEIEILSVLRRAVRRGDLAPARALQARQDWADTPVTLYPHSALLDDIWALRNNLNPYDAAYIALAEVKGVPLISCDAKMHGAPGHHARVELF